MKIFIIIIFNFSLIFGSALSKAAVSKKINSGDTVFNILRKHKFNTKHLGQAFQKKVLPKSFSLVPGEKYYVVNEQGNYQVRFYDNKSDKKFIFWRDGTSAGSKISLPNYRVRKETVHGRVVGSLIVSIAKQIPDKQVAYRFMDAFSYDYNLRRQLQRGAKFSLTVEKKYEGKDFIKYGEVLMARIEIKGKTVTRYFVPYADGGAFVANHWSQSDRPFYAPAAYSHFSSLFSYRRKHPIQGYRKPHLGLDFELPQNAKIFAVSPGKVLRMGKNRAAGNYVVLRHSNGLESYYNHLAKIDSSVKKGGFVAQGQEIGRNGCTGYCTKPHLHLAIKKNGRFVNPIKYLKSYPYHRKNKIKKELAQLKTKKRIL